MENKTNHTDDVELSNIDINNSSCNNEIIYPNAEVRVEKAQFSITHLQTLCRKRKELLLDPDFQRNKVWKTRQESELIESILMGIPIPLMYLFEDKKGKKQVVDGKQRITAILNFLENNFKLSGLSILSQLNGLSFDQLDPKLQGVFEDYQLFFYIIQPPTPERVKYDIFDRVNRGGTTLNKQEMRNALYRGKCTDMLSRLCKTKAFLEATGDSISTVRMKDQYVVLRAIAFLMMRWNVYDKEIDINIEYKGDIDDFLAKFMIYINESATDQIINKYEELFKVSMERSLSVLGNNGFRFQGMNIRRPVNMPLLEALIYLFSFPVSDDKQDLKQKIMRLKSEFDNSKFFSGNIDSTTSIAYRFGRIEDLLKK